MNRTKDISDLMARRDYATVAPLLREELAKHPKNVRLRLQLADALAGVKDFEQALAEYEITASQYETSNLPVQASGVRKKAERVFELAEAEHAEQAADHRPTFETPLPKSPFFEALAENELARLLEKMELESYEEGAIIISEGDDGCSLYVIVSGEVKVYTRGRDQEPVYLAKLTDGDFFGEISLLTGKQRTATIAAATRSDLLRLDKDKFDELAATQPRIRELLTEASETRAGSTVEAMIDSMKRK